MAQQKHEKLGKAIEKLAIATKKDGKLTIDIKKASELEDIEFIKTGIEPFDAIYGGFPRGRFSLVYGGSGVGKTTMMLQAAGHIIENNNSVLIMEPETRAEKKWWGKHVDLNKIYISRSTSLGDTLDSLIKIVKTGSLDIVFIDSLAALAVKEIGDKGTEGDHMAIVARRMPQFFQKATEVVNNSKTAVVFIHQKRDVLDMYASEIETYNGGNALKHHCSMVYNVRRASTKNDADKGERFKGADKARIGFMSNLTCKKGTVGTICEGQSVQLDFMYNKGFVSAQSTAFYAIRNKIMMKAGPGQYIFNDGKSEYSQRGIMNVVHDIADDQTLRERILLASQKHVWEDTRNAEQAEPDMEYEMDQITNVAEETVATQTISDPPEEQSDAKEKKTSKRSSKSRKKQ